jgi:Lectin C-type domain
MSRLWVSVLLAGACGFEGGAGIPGELSPDASAVDAGVTLDAPAPVDRCAAFTTIGTGHYQLSTDALTWSDASARCKSMPGAHLATFETNAEIALVVQELPLTVEAWTGVIQKKPTNGIGLNWINDPPGTPIAAAFPWDAGEPNDAGGLIPRETGVEDFAELRSNGRFNDEKRDNLNRALCECEPGT